MLAERRDLIRRLRESGSAPRTLKHPSTAPGSSCGRRFSLLGVAVADSARAPLAPGGGRSCSSAWARELSPLLQRSSPRTRSLPSCLPSRALLARSFAYPHLLSRLNILCRHRGSDFRMRVPPRAAEIEIGVGARACGRTPCSRARDRERLRAARTASTSSGVDHGPRFSYSALLWAEPHHPDRAPRLPYPRRRGRTSGLHAYPTAPTPPVRLVGARCFAAWYSVCSSPFGP